MPLPKVDKIKFWGDFEKPLEQYRLEFLEKLSTIILNCEECKQYSDLIAFAFFCRKKNLGKLLSLSKLSGFSLGIGTVFHITPKNIPMNFALSFIFGYLSGNSNIVKAPISLYHQARLFVKIWKDLENRENIRTVNLFLDFDREDTELDLFIKKSDAILVWGGDETIRKINSYERKPNAIFWSFPDRFSISVIDSQKFNSSDNKRKLRMCHDFFNDSLIVDQNACSSPSAIFWLGKENESDLARKFFWESFNKFKYDVGPVEKIDRAILMNKLIKNNKVEMSDRNWTDSFLNILFKNPEEIDLRKIRGKFGIFLETKISDLKELSFIFDQKLQTVAIYGVEEVLIKELIVNEKLSGCDRIVPIGRALDFSLTWDGRDSLQVLTRKIF